VTYIIVGMALYEVCGTLVPQLPTNQSAQSQGQATGRQSQVARQFPQLCAFGLENLSALDVFHYLSEWLSESVVGIITAIVYTCRELSVFNDELHDGRLECPSRT